MAYIFELSTVKQNCVRIYTDGSDEGTRGKAVDIPVPLIVSTYQNVNCSQNDTYYTDFMRNTPYVAKVTYNNFRYILHLFYIKGGKESAYAFDLGELIPKHLDPFLIEKGVNELNSKAEVQAKPAPSAHENYRISINVINSYNADGILISSVTTNEFLNYLRGLGFNFSRNKFSKAEYDINNHLRCKITKKPLAGKTLYALTVDDTQTWQITDFDLENLMPAYVSSLNTGLNAGIKTKTEKFVEDFKCAYDKAQQKIQSIKQGIKPDASPFAYDSSLNNIGVTGATGIAGDVSAYQDKTIKSMQDNFNRDMAATLLYKLQKDKEIKELKSLSLEKDKLINELKNRIETLNDLTKEQNDVAIKLAQKVLVQELTNRKLHQDNVNLVSAGNTLAAQVKAQSLNELQLRIKKELLEREVIMAGMKLEKIRENSFSNMIKKDAAQAVYRVGATQMMKALKAAIVALLQTNGKDNQTIQVISELLDSDIGVAILSCVCGYSVDQLVDDNEVASKFAEELRVSGMALAGNAAFETLFGLITSSIVPILSTVEQETKKVRVLEEKIEQVVEEDVKDEKLLKAC